MRTSFVLLLLLTGAFPVVAQQAPARPATLPVRHRLAAGYYNSPGISAPTGINLGIPPGGGKLAADTPPAPVPTVRAAAAYAALPTRPGSEPATAALPLAPRYYPTALAAGPPYDLYQNLPEEFRKHTLRAPWNEPLPLQLLRGALGR